MRHRQLQPAATARRPRALPAVAVAARRPETSTPRTDPTIPADPITLVDPVGRADPGADPVGPADLITQAHPVALADLITQAHPVALADLITQAHPVALADLITQADPVALADLITRADPVAPRRGMGMLIVATSTGRRGEMDRHPGDRVNRRGRTGADRSRRLEGNG